MLFVVPLPQMKDTLYRLNPLEHDTDNMVNAGD